MPHDTNRVRVAAVNDYDLVVQGLAALLSRYADRLEVVDRITIGEPIEHGPIDVALFDSYGRVGVGAAALRELAEDPQVRRVAVFGLDFRPQVLHEARAAGAAGFISKALPGDAIADAIVRVSAGEAVEALSASTRIVDPALDWPGKAAGLTERESQILALCAEGYTNREIAAALYIGVETVKTHLKNIFRRLGLRNRTQTVAYIQRSGGLARDDVGDAVSGTAR